MKTLRMFGMVLMAVLMCVNFAACSSEEAEPNFSEKVTVNFDFTGHLLDIQDTPLGRAASDDLYGIQVYTITNTGDKLPYAYGCFTSLENVTLDLIKSQKYKFEATVIIEGYENASLAGDFSWNDFKDEVMGKFTYKTTTKIEPGSIGSYANLPYDRYYGILEEYSPTENGTVTIDTKRMSYGIKFIAENMNNGYLTIAYDYGANKTVNLTTDAPTHEQIYTIYATLSNVYKFYDTYSTTISATITWKQNDDDTGTPLGTFSITIKPNVKSVVKINVSSIGTTSNGITILTEETDMIEEEYTIENGELL